MEATLTTVERRRFPRYPYRTGVKMEWGAQTMERQTRLLSIGGMFIECPDPLWVGATFSALLQLDVPVRVDCVVRMVEAGQGMGVEFLDVAAEAREQIERCVATLAAK